MNNKKIKQQTTERERGAALVTVIMISALLSIACIALLSGVGANSRNSTDVLSEAKAYYAAESGLQATINVLRGNTDTTPTNPNDDITYTKAVTLSTSNYSGDPSTQARLSAWLPTYNCSATGSISVGPLACTAAGTSYSVVVSDPDDASASTTYTTLGTFQQSDGTYAATRVFGDATNNLTVSFVNVSPPATVVHPATGGNTFGSFRLVKNGSGGQIPTDANGGLRFEISYVVSAPRTGKRTFRGKITQADPTQRPVVKHDSYVHELAGSTIELCSDSACTTSGTAFSQLLTYDSSTVGTDQDTEIYAKSSPFEPRRLKILSTGYGPNGARKQLEGIVQKNFFDDLASGSPLTAIGPCNTNLDFGDSKNVLYSGNDASSGISVPAIGVTASCNLDIIEDTHNVVVDPPAAILTDAPDWQSSPITLDELVSQLRTTAMNSGRYFPSGQNPPDFGNPNGQGITFCDGDCRNPTGNPKEGGGILVVTGKLTMSQYDFYGLIIVTGAGGIELNGGGGSKIVGNIVVAPYDSTSLATDTFNLAPNYQLNGANLDIIQSTLDTQFDGLDSISNFMLGVAEK